MEWRNYHKQLNHSSVHSILGSLQFLLAWSGCCKLLCWFTYKPQGDKISPCYCNNVHRTVWQQTVMLQCTCDIKSTGNAISKNKCISCIMRHSTATCWWQQHEGMYMDTTLVWVTQQWHGNHMCHIIVQLAVEQFKCPITIRLCLGTANVTLWCKWPWVRNFLCLAYCTR